MSYCLERIAGAKGSRYYGDTATHTGLSFEVISCVAPTVIEVLTGRDSKGNPVDLKTFMNISSGPTLGTGVLLTVPIDWAITEIKLTSGAVVLN